MYMYICIHIYIYILLSPQKKTLFYAYVFGHVCTYTRILGKTDLSGRESNRFSCICVCISINTYEYICTQIIYVNMCIKYITGKTNLSGRDDERESNRLSRVDRDESIILAYSSR